MHLPVARNQPGAGRATEFYRIAVSAQYVQRTARRTSLNTRPGECAEQRRSGRVGRCYGLQRRPRWFESNLRLHLLFSPWDDRPPGAVSRATGDRHESALDIVHSPAARWMRERRIRLRTRLVRAWPARRRARRPDAVAGCDLCRTLHYASRSSALCRGLARRFPQTPDSALVT